MKMKNKLMIASTVFIMTSGLTLIAQAAETTGEKIETTADKAGDKMKKGARAASDEACEMVHGKMHCAGKKMKHKVQNATDSMGTKAKETKNQVD